MFGFDKMFDFNRDGKLDGLERGAQFCFIDQMCREESRGSDDDWDSDEDDDEDDF